MASVQTPSVLDADPQNPFIQAFLQRWKAANSHKVPRDAVQPANGSLQDIREEHMAARFGQLSMGARNYVGCKP